MYFSFITAHTNHSGFLIKGNMPNLTWMATSPHFLNLNTTFGAKSANKCALQKLVVKNSAKSFLLVKMRLPIIFHFYSMLNKPLQSHGTSLKFSLGL